MPLQWIQFSLMQNGQEAFKKCQALDRLFPLRLNGLADLELHVLCFCCPVNNTVINHTVSTGRCFTTSCLPYACLHFSPDDIWSVARRCDAGRASFLPTWKCHPNRMSSLTGWAVASLGPWICGFFVLKHQLSCSPAAPPSSHMNNRWRFSVLLSVMYQSRVVCVGVCVCGCVCVFIQYDTFTVIRALCHTVSSLKHTSVRDFEHF